MQSVKNPISVVMIGDSMVGKTAILHRYIKNKFDEDRITPRFQCDFLTKEVTYDGQDYKMHVWDYGIPRTQVTPISLVERSDLIMIVFDVSDKLSYKSVKDWYRDMRQRVPYKPIIIVANKIDTKCPQVTTVDYAKITKLDPVEPLALFEVSAKLGTGVEEMFDKIVDTVLDNRVQEQERKAEQERKKPKLESSVCTVM